MHPKYGSVQKYAVYDDGGPEAVAAREANRRRFEAELYAPQPVNSAEDLAEAWLKGLQRAQHYLLQHGFTSTHDNQSGRSVALHHGKLLFDFRLQPTKNVAYVTSAANSTAKAPKSAVYVLRNEIKTDWCIQIVTTAENPSYVPLEPAQKDPAEFVFRSIVGYAAMLFPQWSNELPDAIRMLPDATTTTE